MGKRIGWAVLALAGVAARAGGEEPVKVDQFRLEGGSFIDDPIAFTADGKTVAYLTTDGATGAELHIVPLGAREGQATVKYPSITPERVDFLDDERVLVVERSQETQLARAQIFTRKGPTKDKFGPATDIVLATVSGAPAIVTYLRTPKGSAATHTVTAVRRDTLKPIGKKVLAEGPDGRVAIGGVAMKLLFFEDGYTELIAQREGDYDPKHDIRKPDLEARLDVFAGRVVAQRELKDLVAWSKLVQVRKKHQNESSFVLYSEDQKHLELVDSDDETSQLELPDRIDRYDATTLAYQPIGPGELLVSLTIDPVNPAAVKAQKADKDWIYLFKLDVKRRALTEVARFDGQKRRSSWRIAGSRLGLLRKHKGFPRGGMELEVYDLGAKALPAASPAPVAPAPSAPAPPPPAK